jgi:CheY-like chemotaxis protein
MVTTASNRRTGRILIVDDEEPIRSMLQDGLSRAGYDVETAASGPEALERFQVGRYAVVLTDLIMPAMTGWELSARLRSADPGLPIVILSAYGVTLEDEAARRRVLLVHKPAKLEVVVSAIGKALATGSAQPEAWTLS